MQGFEEGNGKHQADGDGRCTLYGYRYAVLTIVLVSVLMAVIDSTVVNIALPTMTRSFSADLSQFLDVLEGQRELVGAHHTVEVEPGEVFALIAQQIQGGLVGVEEVARKIIEEDTIHGAVEERPVAGFVLEQFGLGVFALGDVTHHRQDPALAAELALTEGDFAPEQLAVLAARAPFKELRAGLDGTANPAQGLDLRIGGVAQAEVRRAHPQGFCSGETEHPERAVVDIQHPGGGGVVDEDGLAGGVEDLAPGGLLFLKCFSVGRECRLVHGEGSGGEGLAGKGWLEALRVPRLLPSNSSSTWLSGSRTTR